MTGRLLPNKGEGGLSEITGQIRVGGNQTAFKNDAVALIFAIQTRVCRRKRERRPALTEWQSRGPATRRPGKTPF